MALERLEFTKNWENPLDFPTYEAEEQKIRADLQLLHDEARAALNKLVDALSAKSGAEQVGFMAKNLQASSVAEAIEEVFAALQEASMGVVPAGSVGMDKLTDEVLDNMAGHMEKAGGTFTGAVSAKNGVGAQAQLRNTALADRDTDPQYNGQINWTYG